MPTKEGREQRAKSREKRAEGKEKRAEGIEQRTEEQDFKYKIAGCVLRKRNIVKPVTRNSQQFIYQHLSVSQ